ncbi:MAG: hypothetical protein M1816_006340 [Peltula sp. TS41687]|nr:MAG: hypothetical protein M1816_006340 [Peltula sp. TS41687]
MYSDSTLSIPRQAARTAAWANRGGWSSPVSVRGHSDFHAASLLLQCHACHSRRHASSSTESTTPPRPTPPKRKPALPQPYRDFLDGALRVNHAGELAATLIYRAQTPLLTRSHPSLRPLMARMYEQEAGHLRTFQALLAKHRVRPTAMYPVWQVAASVLGWSTAMMGREAAMACTEAVETEIGGHYNGQLRVLLEMIRELGEERVGQEMLELVECIRRTRDEELEHLDHAVDNDAKKAEGHELLTYVIRGGCRAAIWISERI